MSTLMIHCSDAISSDSQKFAWIYRAVFLIFFLLLMLGSSRVFATESEIVVSFDSSIDLLGQDYRIEVFRDGSVTYVGRRKVKTVGQVRLNVPKSDVSGLIRELQLIRAPEYVPLGAGGVHSSVPDTRIYFGLGGDGKMLEFSLSTNIVYGLTVMQTIERFVPTKTLRCPFVLDRASGSGLELCAYYDNIFQKVIRGGGGDK